MKELKDKLLDAVIELSAIERLDEDLINTICARENISRESFTILFPRGLEDLVDAFFERVDNFMLDKLTNDSYTQPIHIQVSKLLEARFHYMDQNKAFSLSVLNMKARLTYMVDHTFKVADLIWNNVNHKSSGIDFYTRRVILANVYKNCLFHFKKNVPIQDMISYLHKQLKFVGNITKFKKRLCNKG